VLSDQIIEVLIWST